MGCGAVGWGAFQENGVKYNSCESFLHICNETKINLLED